MNERPTRADVLLTVAYTIARRSTCTRLHVGAVAALDGRILATGYNGAPAGTPHCSHPPSEVCQRSVHAEANVVAYAARHGVSLRGAEIYATDSPCYTCACLLINAGVSQLVFTRKYRDESGLRLMAEVGIKCYHVEANDEEPPMMVENPWAVRAYETGNTNQIRLEGLIEGGAREEAQESGIRE